MAKFGLIGGKSPDHYNFDLELKIFTCLNLHKPKILFIPYATYPNLILSIDKFKNITHNLNLEVRYLETLDENTVNELFAWADVIYFGGGDAKELVSIVKTSPILKNLLEACYSNKLFLGMSAGAILLSFAGMGDKYAYSDGVNYYNYQMVEGLGILKMTVCPHYNHNGLEKYNDEVKKYEFSSYALDDDTAILFNGNKRLVFKTNRGNSVYLFDYNNDYLMIPLYEER